MRASLNTLCNRFIENRDIVKATFAWDSSYMYPICAAIITDKGMRADEERLRHCRDLLKEQTGVFSNFRSTAKIAMIAMMSVDPDPSGKLQKALQVYDHLKAFFWSSEYLPVAAMIIADLVEPVHYKEIAAHTRRIYERMKSEHPFLTSGEDSVFAAMLALGKRPDEWIVAETEHCYRLMKEKFFSSNAVQSLSHVLALCDGQAEVKCRAAADLFDELKARGYRYGTDYELATLGVLAALPVEREVVVQDVIDVTDFLASQRGYGILGLAKKQRIMHAGMIVTSDYMKGDHTMSSAAIHAALSLIAAQQAAMCAAIAASSAAAHSNS